MSKRLIIFRSFNSLQFIVLETYIECYEFSIKTERQFSSTEY